jgi:hypothetical protein
MVPEGGLAITPTTSDHPITSSTKIVPPDFAHPRLFFFQSLFHLTVPPLNIPMEIFMLADRVKITKPRLSSIS